MTITVTLYIIHLAVWSFKYSSFTNFGASHPFPSTCTDEMWPFVGRYSKPRFSQSNSARPGCFFFCIDFLVFQRIGGISDSATALEMLLTGRLLHNPLKYRATECGEHPALPSLIIGSTKYKEEGKVLTQIHPTHYNHSYGLWVTSYGLGVYARLNPHLTNVTNPLTTLSKLNVNSFTITQPLLSHPINSLSLSLCTTYTYSH